MSEWRERERERETDLSFMKTDRLYFKTIVLEKTSNIIQCRYFVCPRLLVTLFGIFRSNAAHFRDYGFCYESSEVTLRNLFGTTRVLCDTSKHTKWSYSKKCLLKFRRNFSDFTIYKRIRFAEN